MAELPAPSVTRETNAVREAIEDRVSQPNGALISGRYRIEGVLGTGGMGTVYLAQHIHMRKRFALKMLHAETSQVPELVARFEREAVAMSRAEHPNIAVATDFGRAENGAFFLVIEYIEGYSLRNALATGPIEISRVVHIARQIGSALERSHELGIIHRDLKPENIMLVPRQGDFDFVKILDFGLAKLATEAQELEDAKPERVITRLGAVFGTPRYMAPEQCVGEAVDGRADLYALGLMMYEGLTGLHPFDERDPRKMLRHHLSTPIPPMKTRSPAVRVPASLETLVRRLVEKQRDDRPPGATEFLRELAEICEREGLATKDPSAQFATRPQTSPGTHIRPTAAEVNSDAMVTQDVPNVTAPQDLSSGSVTQDVPPITVTPNDSSANVTQDAPDVNITQDAPGTNITQDAPGTNTNTTQDLPAANETREVKEPTPQAITQPPKSPEIPSTKAAPASFLQRQTLLLLLPSVLLAVILGVLLLRPQKVPTTPNATSTSAPKTVVAGPAAVPVSPSDLAPKAQLDEGRMAGPPALLELIRKYPTDPRLPQALALSYIAYGNGLEALRWQVKSLELAETSLYDGEIVEAATLALNRPEQQADALLILEEKLGPHGVDVLYTLSAKPGALKNKLSRSLAKVEVRGRASPATLIAMDLGAATRCLAKRALLDRAAQHGDQRTLAQLKILSVTRGCGGGKSGDCWPCLRKDSALRDAIASINARASLPH